MLNRRDAETQSYRLSGSFFPHDDVEAPRQR